MHTLQYNFNHKKFISHTSTGWIFALISLALITLCVTSVLKVSITLTVVFVLLSFIAIWLIYLVSLYRREKTILTIRKTDNGLIVSYFYKNDPENEYGNEIEYFRIKDFYDYEICKNKLYLYGDITLYSPRNGKIIENKMNRIAIYDYFSLNEDFFEILKNN